MNGPAGLRREQGLRSEQTALELAFELQLWQKPDLNPGVHGPAEAVVGRKRWYKLRLAQTSSNGLINPVCSTTSSQRRGRLQAIGGLESLYLRRIHRGPGHLPR